MMRTCWTFLLALAAMQNVGYAHSIKASASCSTSQASESCANSPSQALSQRMKYVERHDSLQESHMEEEEHEHLLGIAPDGWELFAEDNECVGTISSEWKPLNGAFTSVDGCVANAPANADYMNFAPAFGGCQYYTACTLTGVDPDDNGFNIIFRRTAPRSTAAPTTAAPTTAASTTVAPTTAAPTTAASTTAGPTTAASQVLTTAAPEEACGIGSIANLPGVGVQCAQAFVDTIEVTTEPPELSQVDSSVSAGAKLSLGHTSFPRHLHTLCTCDELEAVVRGSMACVEQEEGLNQTEIAHSFCPAISMMAVSCSNLIELGQEMDCEGDCNFDLEELPGMGEPCAAAIETLRLSQVDSSVSEGAKLKLGAVSFLRNLQNPLVTCTCDELEIFVRAGWYCASMTDDIDDKEMEQFCPAVAQLSLACPNVADVEEELDMGCVTPEPTPSPTPEPTPSPTPEPTPSTTPEPTPSTTPEQTPSPTPDPCEGLENRETRCKKIRRTRQKKALKAAAAEKKKKIK